MTELVSRPLARLLPIVLATGCAGAPASTTVAPPPASSTASAPSPGPAGASVASAQRPRMMDLAPTTPDRLGVLAPGTGVPVGKKAPDFRARDLDGKDVALSSLYAKGTVLLAFYRGGWCPFCNTEIHALTAAFPEYQKRGVTPIAVSVDRPEEGAKTKAVYEIPFPVLSDSDASGIEAFHVVKHLEGPELEKMKGFGVDLESRSGKTHHEIAIPALFVIDRTGIVRWAHSDPEYKVRPTTPQILAAIDALKLSSPSP